MRDDVDVRDDHIKELQEEIVRLKACLSASEEARDANFKAKDSAFLQVGELQKDLAHWKDCHGATADKLEESNRLNGEMKTILDACSQQDCSCHRRGVTLCGSCRARDLLYPENRSAPVQIESDGCAVCGHPMEGHDIAGNCEKHGCDCSL